MFAVIIVGVFTITLFAQGPHSPLTQSSPNTGNGQVNRLAVLAKALNLSDTQVTSIRHAIEAAQPSLRTKFQDVKAKRQALKAATSAANPDATAVGTAFLALQSSEADLKTDRRELQATIRNLLTPDQQKSMSALKVVAQARHNRFRQLAGGAILDAGQ